jgi:uncharacterized membrane protein
MSEADKSLSARLYRNIRILVAAVALVFFYFAVSGIVKKVTNGSETYTTYFVVLGISLALFGVDGDLGELVGRHSEDYAAVSAVAAVTQ